MLKIRQILLLLLLLASSFICKPAFSQEKKGTFRDTLDNAFDISKFLLELHGFLPLVSPITEPALGYGAVVAGVYFISKEKTETNEFKMPDIVGAGAGYTQNGSWFGGGGYAGFWKDGAMRYRGIAGYGSINMKYYGAGDNMLDENPVSFNIGSFFFLQQMLFRIGQSNFMLGGNYVLNNTKVAVEGDGLIPGAEPVDFDLVNSGITLIGEFETLNNILSPTRGIRINLSFRNYSELLGSDKTTRQISFFTHAYQPIFERWVAAIRFESVVASENTPFFMLPFISLRGVPLLRYQGEMTMLAETEQYLRVFRRWGLVAFAGYGKTIPVLETMDWGAGAWNAGLGFRYQIARALGLNMGMDFARGPESWAFYIVFGSSWLK